MASESVLQPPEVTERLAEELTARNLVPTEGAKVQLMVDTEARFSVQVNGRYRWNVNADVSLVPGEAEEAMARGDDQGARPLSKKEQDKIREEKNNTQGKRLRKQGAKANKFDAEAAGKKANGKNKLLH